jgi:hypothetical protein
MSSSRTFLRWLPTFLAFPAAGLLTISTIGPLRSPAAGLVGGAVAGAVLGGAQWLALRASGIGRAWWLATVVGAAVGTALGVAATGAGTSTSALVVRGLLTGAVLGLGQAVAVRRPPARVAAWAATTTVAWGLGWLVTANVIVDADRGFVVFGSSGALVATIVTGLALPVLLGRGATTAAAAGESAAVAIEVAR